MPQPRRITPMLSPPATQPAPSAPTHVLRHTPAAIPNVRSLGHLRRRAREREERARAQRATAPRHANPEVQLPTPPATQAATTGMSHCFLPTL